MRELPSYFARLGFFSALALGAVAIGACSSSDGGATSAPKEEATPASMPFSQAVSPHEVALYQSVKISLFKDGEATTERNAPVVAGRPALVRLFTSLRDPRRFQKSPLKGELHSLEGDAEVDVVEVTALLDGSSSDGALATTLNFSLTGEQIKPGRSVYFVVRPCAGDESIRHPAEGALDLGALAGGEKFCMKFVPIRYEFSGGEVHQPETTDEDLAPYRDVLKELFPVASVDFTVRAPVVWTEELRGDGTGWNSLLDEMMALRQRDRAPANVFYAGFFKTTRSIIEYCGNGCLLGLAPLVGQIGDVRERVGLIANYPGSADTMAHELGHALGREHAPCGDPAGIDKDFPYANAELGTWGYSLLKNELVDPGSSARDLLSYCSPRFVSDYTYTGLFSRISSINGVKLPAGTIGLANGNDLVRAALVEPPKTPQRYRQLVVEGDGRVVKSRIVELTEPPSRAPETITARAGSQMHQLSGHVTRTAHTPGGIVLVRERENLPRFDQVVIPAR